MNKLLIEEMKRAITLLGDLDNDARPTYSNGKTELRQILKLVRKHSIQLEKDLYTPYWRKEK